MLVFAISAVAWPATVASAHWDVEAGINPHECTVVVRWDPHIGSNHDWSDHISWDGRWLLRMRIHLSPHGIEERDFVFFGYHALETTDTPAVFSLRDVVYFVDFSPDATWWWKFVYAWWLVDEETGKLTQLPYFYETKETAPSIVPKHCATPAVPLCQFVGGLGDWVQQHPIVGTCRNNEQFVEGGSVQSTTDGILLYDGVRHRLAFFYWSRVWQALDSSPATEPQLTTIEAHAEEFVSAVPNCLLIGDPDVWIHHHTASGKCLTYKYDVRRGVIQASKNGILLFEHRTQSLRFYDWARVWQVLAVSPNADAQTVPVAAAQPVAVVPAAPHCQFVLGFAHWVQQNPGAGNCHNNEQYVTGGSLQSTQNGVLFYDRDNHRLRFFHWAQVWQAVAPLPFAQPQLPPSAESQATTHCQFVLGFGNWVQQHADAGACLNSEQFLASGSVQSTQNGILFYDSSSQRLGFFNWEQVWQGLASLASSQ